MFVPVAGSATPIRAWNLRVPFPARCRCCKQYVDGALQKLLRFAVPASVRPRRRKPPGPCPDRDDEAIGTARDVLAVVVVALGTGVATGSPIARRLEARHRAHARVEDRIRHAKDNGLGRFPSREFAINTAWLSAVAIAADLVAWLRLLALTGPLATAEPKALCYRLLHVPARLTRSARRRNLRLPANWPWVDDLLAAFARIAAIPLPARPTIHPDPEESGEPQPGSASRQMATSARTH